MDLQRRPPLLVLHDEILGASPQGMPFGWVLREQLVFHLALAGFLVAEWVQFRKGVRWMWRGVWRGTWLEALMLLLALVFGTRHAAQEFIYFAF